MLPPAPGPPSGNGATSGASIRVGVLGAVDEAGQVAVVSVGPARGLVGEDATVASAAMAARAASKTTS